MEPEGIIVDQGEGGKRDVNDRGLIGHDPMVAGRLLGVKRGKEYQTLVLGPGQWE
jgi:hypothetical protein